MYTKLLISILLVVDSASAQTIYKCTDAKGTTTFSERPCGNNLSSLCFDDFGNAREGVCVQNPAKDVAPQYTDQHIASEVKSTATVRRDSAVQAISDSVADSNCRRNASRLAAVPPTAKIENAQAQIASLRNRVWTGRNAAQVQNMRRADEQEIIGLEQIISQEQSHNDQIKAESDRVVRAALFNCDTQKAQRDKAREP